LKQNELNSRLRKVRLVIFDVDGVLTDGTIYLQADGREMKAFNVLDGTGIKYLQRVGLEVALLSGRRSAAVRARARELGIKHVVQGAKIKLEGLEKLLAATGLSVQEVCFVGDDLPDIPVMRKAGVGVAVANARPEVLAVAQWVTDASGGKGAVREVAEKLLKAQDKWKTIMSRYDDVNSRRGKGRRV
jgi:3-deoxy-D-manno-octulosonate 8-phosphate phosphatase (KDO 8-P phosphatase)